MNIPPDKQRKALGRGLSALLPQRSAATAVQPATEPVIAGPQVASIPIADIQPNPLQPRSVFEATRLEELANSIETHGIIQPLLVRRQGPRYELIAGERRLRAAKLAGLVEVPCIVQDYADDRILEIALIENIQREDLNPMETAQALERLHTEMNLSHEEIAARTGKDRTTITNMIRLLRLPARRPAPGCRTSAFDGTRPRDSRPANPRTADASCGEGRRSGLFGPSGRAASQEGERTERALRESSPGPEHQSCRGKSGSCAWYARHESLRNQTSAAGSRSNTTRRKNCSDFTSGFHLLDRQDPRTDWCRRQESNLRPTDYETVALTT